MVTFTYVFDDLAQTVLTPHQSFRATNDIVTVREKTCNVGRRVGHDV